MPKIDPFRKRRIGALALAGALPHLRRSTRAMHMIAPIFARAAGIDVAALLVACAVSAAPAQAATPDITRYCQTYVHPGVPNSYSTKDGHTPMFCVNSKGTPGVDGARGILPQVDLAAACSLTNGSEEFRYIDGFKIDCGRAPRPYVSKGPGVQILEPEHLDKFCAKALGPGARAEFSAALKRAVCTGAAAPPPNPLTINYALACYFAFKTDKVRYVDDGEMDLVACVK